MVTKTTNMMDVTSNRIVSIGFEAFIF